MLRDMLRGYFTALRRNICDISSYLKIRGKKILTQAISQRISRLNMNLGTEIFKNV